MINPQMGLPNVPPVKELWKNEKEKYRHWILLFGIGILVIFAMQLTSFILNMISADTIKATLQDRTNDYLGASLTTAQRKTVAAEVFTKTFLVMPIVQFSLVGLGIFYFIVTVFYSYKHHSFAKISQWATMVIGLGTFVAVYQLLQMAISKSSRIVLDNDFPGGIFQFINYFLVIGVYFGAAVKVSKIRRQFAISERVERLKNDPMFQQQMEAYKNMMQNGGMSMGPMGPMVNPQATNVNNPQLAGAKNNQTQQNISKPEVSKEEKELNAMSITELKQVAKELSISGYNRMKKTELIKAILRVSNK